MWVLKESLVLGSTWVSCYYKRTVSRYARWLRWFKLSIWCDWSHCWVVWKPWVFMMMNGGGNKHIVGLSVLGSTFRRQQAHWFILW